MRWRILGKLKSADQAKRQAEIIKILFKNRGLITKLKKEQFLQPEPPWKLSLKEVGLKKKDLDQACVRIQQAIDRGEKIIVYGDYDTDGICGTAILWETLNILGAQVLPYIPDRTSEGYGLNIETIKKLRQQSPELKVLITVDQGITAHEKIDFANKIGLDVIISDHHVLTKTKPQALAIVHTVSLSGSGVAWFFSRELIKNIKPHLSLGKKLRGLLELAAIGTITDLLPLIGPNRSIIIYGLKELNQTDRLGLQQLLKAASLERGKIGTYEVGFIIGPRLNASGRIEHALDSLRLLCTTDKDRALKLALKLNRTNQRRQSLMEETALAARETWLAQKIKSSRLIFIDGEGWEQGVIGLAASRLVEEFYLPVIVVSRGETHSKASARSISGFNIIEAIREAENLLVDVGGHPMAAGFTVETKNLDKLKEKLITIAEQRIDSRLLEKTLKIDCELSLTDLSLSFYNHLNQFAPFGVGNPQPDFVSRKVEIVEARLVGRESRHLKLVIRDPQTKQTFAAIGFGMAEFYQQLTPEVKIDLAYNLILDEWNGNRNLNLRVKDLKIRKTD